MVKVTDVSVTDSLFDTTSSRILSWINCSILDRLSSPTANYQLSKQILHMLSHVTFTSPKQSSPVWSNDENQIKMDAKIAYSVSTDASAAFFSSDLKKMTFIQ